MAPRVADHFIRDLRAEARDADSVRLTISAVSSFFSYVEKRYQGVRNPIRGTKARPRATIPTAVIPTKAELDALQAEADPILAAALSFIRETGCSACALPSLAVHRNGSWHATNKGEKIIGAEALSVGTIRTFRRARLNPTHPFDPVEILGMVKHLRGSKSTLEDQEVAVLKSRLARLCGKLHRPGKIRAAFSFRDVRHAFAKRNAGRGLRWLSARFGHASISITERYLRSVLNVDTSRNAASG